MSRSKRKIAKRWATNAGTMKKWKKEGNRMIRSTIHSVHSGKNNTERLRTINEIPSGAYYKRFNDEWSSPSDGKIRTDWSSKPWKTYGK